jgi:molybdopterin/thiamine biosynthesis adenylyltransferase/predicted RNA-binding Zn-ribbon protein involved in translation (DUF1610 family)
MADATIHISPEQTRAEADGRFDRFRLIGWWDQRKLAQAKVLVIGAGALGNEIIKNLALLGVGNLFVADKDRVENSNLSRSILYREADMGRAKAEVAVEAARGIYPQINAHCFAGDVVHDLGMGVYRWADLVIGGLDNREARLAINRNCWKVNRPWIDGAIEQIQGVARIFLPGGPCYECTMSQRDWQLLQSRRSCNLLTRAQMQEGKTPTTPTISSIIAGVQCQEAVKLIHGMPTIGGRGWVFDGISTEAYQTEYQRKADCYSHDTLDEIVSLDETCEAMTLRDLLRRAREHVGDDAKLELSREVLEKLVCHACGQEEVVFESLGRINAERATCPHCGGGREPVLFDTIRGEERFLDRTPAQIGLPPLDIFIASGGGRSIGLELSGDAARVLGPLVADGLEWV